MEYSRSFMPLLNEAKGYDFKGLPPTGRCILEERGNTGKLKMWVQDLRPETKYEIYLVFEQERQHIGLCIGQFDVGTKGRAELRRDILPEDLHNFILKEIVAVAVIAADADSIVSPLCGYRNAQVPWRHNFRVWEKDAIAPPRATKPLSTATFPSCEASEPPQSSNSPTDTLQLIEAIFNTNSPIEPLKKQNREIKWARCNSYGQIPLPQDRPHLMSEPFMLTAWADHEHFILGITTDDPAQYVIGIPGIFSPERNTAAKRLGFSQFKSHTKERHRTGDEGYWLMYVDL
ncbi:MAG: DUF6128 domain-containing protein [Firmicutes bacterium]|nr:DUF6128 domain-containing protein [Bacillota bacterium]